MFAETARVDAAHLAAFEAILDVRSPAEFAEDHVPGAINLPVLSDAERAEVGTIYTQVSRFTARRVGAALVARNIAAHLEGALADRPGDFAPLIYCWRGGQRSTAMATVLAQVGWRPTRLTGGYRTWRRSVTARLYDGEPAWRLVLLEGHTGSAKTEILARAAAMGAQSLDLEGLADHRGSLFGGFAGRAQPSQKLFESRLLKALESLDRTRPVLVEAESSKIGQIVLPPALWKAMAAAPAIAIEAPAAARAGYLVDAYADIVADPAAVQAALAALPGRHGRKRLAEWAALATAGDFATLAGALMEHHYDPAYDRWRKRQPRSSLGSVTMHGLRPEDREAAARRVAALMAGA
jgi:tRNA 2-selenouridine synthase